MDRLKALSIFKTVVDSGSFIGAANSLDISAPVVTKTVQDLEALLGVRLLHRTTRRMDLTAAGRDVVDRVSALLASYDELESIGRMSAAEPTGAIRLSAPALFGRHYLGSALAAFRQRFPRVLVGLELHEGRVDAVSDGIDLALCLREDLRSAQIARPLAQVEVGIYAAPAYLALRGEPERPSDLAQHDCLISGTGRAGASWSFVNARGGERDTVSVPVAMQSSHAEVVADAASHGAGVVMLPAFMAEAHLARGRLQKLLPAWRTDAMSVHLIYGSRQNQPVSVRRLIEHLIAELGDDAGSRRVAAPQPCDRMDSRPQPALAPRGLLFPSVAAESRMPLAA